ncbi:MAG: tetratricopeptide repeat protein, partial [Ginsengibacter sp.]
MRKLVIPLLLLSYTSNLYCQNIEADSLKKVLATTPESQERVLALEGLSYAYVSAFPDTALQYAMEGLQLAQKINDSRGEAYCTNALGNVYFGVGDYSKALDMYLESLKMKEAIKEKAHSIGVTYFNIANVYTEQEDYKHALSYLFKTKAIDEKVNDSGGILFDLYSLSSIYLRMTMADSALYYIKEAYELAGRLKDKNMIGAILNNYGEISAFKKDMPAAIDYYQQSIVYVKAINDNEVLSSNYFGLAKAYKSIGREDSAIFHARQALNVAQQAPFFKQVLEASTFLAEAYQAAKQYDSAFIYQALGVATKDSLYNVEKIKKVQNLKLTEQQRQQLIEVAKIRYRNRIKLYVAIAALAVFLGIALILWRNNKQKQKAYALLQQQKAITEEALKDLQATQVQLLQKEKMASLGELTAGIAHEIQNPLNFINNFSDINAELLNELQEIRTMEPRDPQLEEDIYTDIKNNFEKIIYHGKRAASIVKNMLLHSRTTEEA